MSSFFSGTATKIVAQIAALVLVVGGLAAFVITQANTGSAVATSNGDAEQTSTEPLNIERVSAISPLNAAQIELPRAIEITVGDETKDLMTSGATVQEVLDNAGVTLGADDKVSPKLDAELNPTSYIVVTRVEKSEVTEEVALDFETTHKNDNTLEKGKTKTQTKGAKGAADVTYAVVKENGEQVSKTETGRTVTKEPTNAVILKGTKEAPAPAPSNSGSSSSSGGNTGASAPAVANGSVWDRLAQCESGGNWSINTGNGYYGGLQFNPNTWLSMGGGQYAPTADKATRAQQIAIASKLQARAGWGQWPACTRAMGLR